VEVGRSNRYVSALFSAACYFISSVAVVNLRSQPQTSPGPTSRQVLPRFYSVTLVAVVFARPDLSPPSAVRHDVASLLRRRKLTHPRLRVRIKRLDHGGHASVT